MGFIEKTKQVKLIKFEKPIKPQYENGEIVCWVLAEKGANDGKYYKPGMSSLEYKIGERIKSGKGFLELGEGFLRLRDARKSKFVHIIIRATTMSKDIIAFGYISTLLTAFPALKTKRMFFQVVCNEKG